MGNPLHFIQASDTSAFAALHTEQGALPSQYEALQAHLKKIGLGRFGTLWAEPVTGQATPAGYASISWYTPLEGVGTPLSRLDAGEAEQARAALRRAREAVAPHLDGTPGGVLLRKALFIPSADNVFVVNGHPVLVNWGLLPQGMDEATAPILWGGPENGEAPSGVAGTAAGGSAAAVAGTAAHDAVPGAGRAAGASAGAGAHAAAAGTAAGIAGATAGNVIVRRSRAGLFGALLLGILLGALLLFLLRSCVKTAPEQPAAPETPPAAMESPEEAARKAEWANLLREKAFWQGLLELTPCELKAFFEGNAGKEDAKPDAGETAPGTAAPETLPGEAVPGLSLPPLPSANATVPAKAVDLSTLTIPQRLEQGTVLILAPVPGGAQQGTGFFINPDHVLTNRHVVANAIDDMVMVTNASLRGARRGMVVARSDAPGYDFAVIKVMLAEGDQVPALPLSPTVNRTDKVSAWGFPALVSEQDPAYLRLLRGDFNAVPEVVFTDGVVNAILQTSPRNIVHSAVVSQGNSGGPLVNEKGDVIGINTFIRLDADSNRQTQTALGSDAVMGFLRGKGIPFTEHQ
ncbi:serine protease [uncultured Bilophila sp.]|uniref:S1 family peptidase n=1 Tax=uncultured Bilophila sp. TaxID=529385 RepID=UPI0026700B7E|nr:trypsin-like peptidase domain-containing protein [uncultured Bilophila sp.]